MAKLSRYTRPVTQPPKRSGIFLLILKGAIMSIVISIFCIAILALLALISENTSIESYSQYILVAVSLVSIFLGSVWATKEIGSKGLIIGMSIGVVYVLISLVIGMELNQETLSVLIVANKLGAGLAAGALGGLVGVNL